MKFPIMGNFQIELLFKAFEAEESCLLLEVDVGRPLVGSLIVVDSVAVSPDSAWIH